MFTDARSFDSNLKAAEIELQSLWYNVNQCIEVAMEELRKPGFDGRMLYVPKGYRRYGNNDIDYSAGLCLLV